MQGEIGPDGRGQRWGQAGLGTRLGAKGWDHIRVGDRWRPGVGPNGGQEDWGQMGARMLGQMQTKRSGARYKQGADGGARVCTVKTVPIIILHM